MAKAWYPVIDYLTCVECGACIQKCSHGVYSSEKAPTPVIRNPEACIDHCHGCGDLCPVGAITYVGDHTGWAPPGGAQRPGDTCCSCGCEKAAEKKVLVEYLYLDLKTCGRCIGTDAVLDEVMGAITPVLRLAGYRVDYRKIEMASQELAEAYRFLSSPTVRVDGRDLFGEVKENTCGCCGEISGTDVDCRVFEYHGQTYEVPTGEMLAEGILRAVFGKEQAECACGEYELPGNLKVFFTGKEKRSGCACC
jgi:NAD-dependent dihydropyrimidine dehydrogenase PreA subunit